MLDNLRVPPLARLWQPYVYFDTQVPRYFAVVKECGVLRAAFPRVRVVTGVQRELEAARPHVIQEGGDLCGLLDDPAWAEVEELTELKDITAARALQCGMTSMAVLASHPLKNLGESETIVRSQQNHLPVVIEDGRAVRAARGRNIAAYRAVHVCAMIALRELRTPEDSWRLYGRLLDAGLQQRDQRAVASDDATRGEFMEIVEAGLIKRGRASFH
jgi:hypothetical protein